VPRGLCTFVSESDPQSINIAIDPSFIAPCPKDCANGKEKLQACENITAQASGALKDLAPLTYVEKWEDLSPAKRYEIKRDYSGKGVIYLFQNKTNNKCYVGSTINFKSLDT